jgi:predicted alpha/beta-hydrolase family hydrolase
MDDKSALKASIEVSPRVGKVSAIVLAPSTPKAVLALAHGAGAGMNHPFMNSLAEALMEGEIATVRFNFPFAEKGKGRPDPAPVAEQVVAAAVAYTQDRFPSVPLFAGGKSFGGRMSSQWMSRENVPNVKGLVFFGFPLHPPGKPASDRAAHLGSVGVPMLFLQGTRDALAEWSLIERVVSNLPNATLEKIDGADHGFRAGKGYMTEELARRAAAWMRAV